MRLPIAEAEDEAWWAHAFMEARKRALLSGDAKVTLYQPSTGWRATYRVRRPHPGSPHFVSLLIGPDNTSSYGYLGTIFDGATYRHGAKSRIGADAQSAVVANYVLPFILRCRPRPRLWDIILASHCLRCGRLLTTPESVAAGMGPECARMAG